MLGFSSHVFSCIFIKVNLAFNDYLDKMKLDKLTYLFIYFISWRLTTLQYFFFYFLFFLVYSIVVVFVIH